MAMLTLLHDPDLRAILLASIAPLVVAVIAGRELIKSIDKSLK